MKIDLPDVVVSNAEISTEQGTVRTSAQLVELLQAHRIAKVRVRLLPEAGYEAIGTVIYGLTRAEIDIELVEPLIAR